MAKFNSKVTSTEDEVASTEDKVNVHSKDSSSVSEDVNGSVSEAEQTTLSENHDETGVNDSQSCSISSTTFGVQNHGEPTRFRRSSFRYFPIYKPTLISEGMS